MECSPPGSSVHGILHARILKWVAMLSSKEIFSPKDWTHISYVSCNGRWVLYHYHHLGSPQDSIVPKDRNIEQWNRTESPQINPWIYSQLIINKGAKTLIGKEQALQQMKFWTTRPLHLVPYTKIYSKMVQGPKIRKKIIKSLEKNMGKSRSSWFGIWEYFFRYDTWSIRKKEVVYSTWSKCKTFVHLNTLSRVWKDYSQMTEFIFKSCIW